MAAYEKMFGCALAALALATGLAAPPPESVFEKVPAPALAALRISKGKMIPAGLVFCNGRLLKGPYIVSRYGTAIRVNREQVTGQIVPWPQFTTAAAAKPQAAVKPPPAAKPPAPPPAASQSVDDLFADDAPPAASPPPRQQPKPAAAEADAPSGDYVDSPRSKALLKRINDYRTDVDRTLRGNGVFFFGVHYAPVRVEPRLAQELLAVLPGVLRDAASAQELHDMLRRKGVTYLSPAVCADLIKDRALYMKVRDRIREIKEEQAFRKMLDGAGGGM